MDKGRVVKPVSWPFYEIEKYAEPLAIKKGNFLFASSISAAQFDSSLRTLACKGNLLEQTQVIYRKLALILEAAGAGFEDVVKTVDYVTPEGLREYPTTDTVRREYFSESFPAATAVPVNTLPEGQGLIAVDCIAVVGGGKKETTSTGDPGFRGLSRSEAARKGDLLCLSGLTDETSTDISSQCRQIYARVRSILEAAGGSIEDLVKTVDYVTSAGLDAYKETGRVRREVFTGTYPVSTGVVLDRLEGDVLIQVDCTAVLGPAKKESISTGNPRFQRLTYHEGVKKGKLLFLAGTAAANPVTGKLAVGDPAAQTRQVYDKLKAVLLAAGSGLDDIVKRVDYVPPAMVKDYAIAAEIAQEYFTGSLPAISRIMIDRLLRAEGLIEIDMMAVLD